MATSRSPDAQAPWIAGVLIYSGRPDPTWPAPAALVEALMGIWNGLAAHRGPVAAPPPLGYRGCFLTDGRREWRAFRGIVTLREAGGAESRKDSDRAFEKRLIVAIPDGLAPKLTLDPL